jgi:ABC-type multidrug transport system fused ATPase/permease subunit
MVRSIFRHFNEPAIAAQALHTDNFDTSSLDSKPIRRIFLNREILWRIVAASLIVALIVSGSLIVAAAGGGFLLLGNLVIVISMVNVVINILDMIMIP